jgi:hypothetical protein
MIVMAVIIGVSALVTIAATREKSPAVADVEKNEADIVNRQFLCLRHKNLFDIVERFW